MNKKIIFIALPIIAILLAVGVAKENTLGASVIRVSQGGTGATTFATGKCLYGNGTDAIYADDCAEGSMVYPGAGIAISTGTGWATSTTDNSANWNTAYGWGNHAGLYDVLGQATSTLSGHTSTYNHANYDTAYGWGNHASANYITDGNTNWDNSYGYITASTTQLTASGNIWAGGFIGNLTGVASGNLISGGTLTSGSICRFDGTGLDCDRVEDASGDCGANAVCMGGHTHSSYLTAVASDSTWTTHDSYPSACSAGQYVSAIGDTLTCATPTGTTYTAGDYLTLTGTDFDVDDAFLFNNGDVGTGNYDFGGATFFEIPNGTAPTADDPGEIAHDTTDNQLILDDKIIRTEELIGGVTIASTSDFFKNIDVPAPLEKDGYTVSRISCYVTGGTSVQVTLTDGTNAMDTLTCATTATADDGTIANNTVTANELMKLDPGTVTGAVNYVSFSWYGYWTRE